jgi:hypothetical protein
LHLPINTMPLQHYLLVFTIQDADVLPQAPCSASFSITSSFLLHNCLHTFDSW